MWTTCMPFFQMILLGGYTYAHLISSRLSIRLQTSVHLVLLLTSLLLLPITPHDSWKGLTPHDPTLRILALLAACGLLLLLATTAQSTRDVAPIPFLWSLLALYLLSIYHMFCP